MAAAPQSPAWGLDGTRRHGATERAVTMKPPFPS